METERIYMLDVADVVTLEQTLEDAGTSLYELMREAGAAIAHAAQDAAPEHGHICVLAGSGNNGGDGWVAAELLAEAGCEVTLISTKEPNALTAEPAATAAQHAREACKERLRVVVAPDAKLAAELLDDAGVVVDALLGTGFAGSELRAAYAVLVSALNTAHTGGGAYVIAADVPSGVSAQTGNVTEPHVTADETVTMMVMKPGLAAAADACGAIHVAQICDLSGQRAFLEAHDVSRS